MKDSSKKRQPCTEWREFVKHFQEAFKLARYIWLTYKATDLFDFVVALLEDSIGPLDHYLPSGGLNENN